MLTWVVIKLLFLKDKADEVIKLLSESHWTSSCIITMKKFQDKCGGRDEASAVLSFLTGRGKALYLSISKNEFTEVLHIEVLHFMFFVLKEKKLFVLLKAKLVLLNCEIRMNLETAIDNELSGYFSHVNGKT